MAIEKKYEQSLADFIAGTISDQDQKALFKAAETNEELAELLGLHSQLTKMHYPIPNPEHFAHMRKETLLEIEQIELEKSAKKQLNIKRFWFNPIVQLAAAAALFLFGFFLNNKNVSNQMVDEMSHLAVNAKDLNASYDSPYIFSNARYKTNEDNETVLSFDVARHFEIKRHKNDPLVQEVLAQSLLNASSISARLNSINSSETMLNPKIKQALISTLLNDTHLIVRKKCLQNLIRYPNDTEIQSALLQLLKNEKSIEMRLVAIDYLGNNNVDKQLIEQELNSSLPENRSLEYHLQQVNIKN